MTSYIILSGVAAFATVLMMVSLLVGSDNGKRLWKVAGIRNVGASVGFMACTLLAVFMLNRLDPHIHRVKYGGMALSVSISLLVFLIVLAGCSACAWQACRASREFHGAGHPGPGVLYALAAIGVLAGTVVLFFRLLFL